MKHFFTLFLFVVMLSGCSSTVPTFYVLSGEGPLPVGSGTGIGVGPVTLAEYVDRQNIVIQTSPNTLELAESHLWAGDLDDSVGRVLGTNIGRRLNTGNVRTYQGSVNEAAGWATLFIRGLFSLVHPSQTGRTWGPFRQRLATPTPSIELPRRTGQA